MTEQPICARCGDEGPLFPASCEEKPERLRGVPIGMYHCPDCGAMVLAGVPHGDLCERCLKREHPMFDKGAE
jgi:hypothetical protein